MARTTLLYDIPCICRMRTAFYFSSASTARDYHQLPPYIRFDIDVLRVVILFLGVVSLDFPGPGVAQTDGSISLLLVDLGGTYAALLFRGGGFFSPEYGLGGGKEF